MKRRDFLHGASWTTIFWGLSLGSPVGADSLSDRRLGRSLNSLLAASQHHPWQNIAAPTARKFALLVGLNRYADSSFPPLAGCLTDLKLQQQLLCHRYGFKPTDILTLADEQATISNFQAAVTTHLINQVQPGDVVVFHFSGYGTQVQGEAALVLFDRVLPLTQWQVWLRSLPTPFITTILDTSFVAEPTPLTPNSPSRSLPVTPPILITPIPLEPSSIDQSNKLDKLDQLNQSLIPSNQTDQTDQEFIPSLPGILLRATVPSQEALEIFGDGFTAGLFTYTFTQKLWQSNPEIGGGNLEKVNGSFKPSTPQSPAPKSSNLGSKHNLPAFFLPPELTAPADGVVMEVAENTATLWLGGLPSQVLNSYGVESLMGAIALPSPIPELSEDNSSEKINSPADSVDTADSVIFQISDRTGFQAKAKILSPEISPKAGTLVQELVRALPHQMPLQIAFDRQLTRVERVDATSAFAYIPEISLGKGSTDYLFTIRNGSYGLSNWQGDLLPHTQGQAGEAVKSAVSRLKRQLHSLLATKLLYLTENSGYQRANHPQVQMTKDAHNPQQYWLENGSDRPLWGLIFCTTTELWVLGSDSGISGITTYELLPHARISVAIPKKLTNTRNIYGVFSSRPLDRTLEMLKTLDPDSKSIALKLSQPLPIVKAIYQDLQTPDPTAFPISSSDNYILDINTWVTFWLGAT